MTKTDHLAKAKDYIAKGEDYHRKAAEEIVAAMAEDAALSYKEIGRRLDKSDQYVRRLVKAVTNATPGDALQVDWESGPKDQPAAAKRVLRDPELRRAVIADLAPAEVEAVIEEAHEVAMDRVRAEQAEHRTKPTARELMGDDPFKPDEFWADSVVIRLHRNARELASLIQRGGGLILGAMEMERAFEHLNEAERLIAEARAAAQEQLRDRAGVA